MTTRAKKTGMILLIFIGSISAYAQKPDIFTDRPDQSNAPLLIPKGSLQIESGFLFEKIKSSGINQSNITFNNTLIKYGVNEYFELRLTNSFLGTREKMNNLVNTNGFSPLGVGVKIKLSDESGFWPQAAVITHVYLKTGSEEYSPAFTPTDICFAFENQLTNKMSLSYNAGAMWGGETPEATFFYTLSLAYKITGRLEFFAESYAYFPEMHQASHRLDSGLLYKITPIFLIDIVGGLGLSENAPNYFVGSGLSVRLFK